MYKLYVNGQLGLPFDTLEECEKVAINFQKEGFDCNIIKDIGTEHE